MIDDLKLQLAIRPLVDTNFLIFALDGGRKHPDWKKARDLFDALVAKKRRILVAAPSLAEFRMKASGRELPLGTIIEVTVFDRDCAEQLAKWLPADQLKELKDELAGTPGARSFITFDAMIASCAVRHNASCIISTDEKHMPKIASKAGIKCLTPSDFDSAQRSLDLPMPPLRLPAPEDDEEKDEP